ncbi:hypothetical protein GXW82_02570 [Streptacidiphilus sp. 4-A2]|nr:hypothetical protein [Streptacidiphilus sp. 4-A2]
MRGCRVGAVHTDPAAELLAAELLFPRPLGRGEAVVTSTRSSSSAPVR